jgi:aminoglycoside phosphotransferase family enzyme/predicted kinase
MKKGLVLMQTNCMLIDVIGLWYRHLRCSAPSICSREGVVVGPMSGRAREEVNRGDSVPHEQKTLIRALQDPALYDHPVGDISLVETHISWVILTGDIVYKIKKAVKFGFLDFSTLERRHFYCSEEVRLNRRFAPDLYLDVVEVTGEPDRPELQGEGQPIEYAVRMRQFAQQALLSSMAASHALTTGHIDEIAELVAAMHDRAAVAGSSEPYGSPGDIHHWVMENFEHIRPALKNTLQRQQFDRLEQWCEREFQDKQDVIHARRDKGFIRECHGDLHLGNLALVDGRITPFDCLEFNPSLRWIDVMSETAFLVMDLQDRGYADLAYRFLNGYLQKSGDYGGVRILRYYLVYRALVRAKVAVLRLCQEEPAAGGAKAAWDEYTSYMKLSRHYAGSTSPALIITHGVSGTGKSWYARRLAISQSAIQIRSDVERKRLFGYPMNAHTGSGIRTGIYTAEAGMKTYARLADLARYVIEGGFTAVVDAAFLTYAERDRFRALAARLGVSFVLLSFTADEDTLRDRIRRRQASGKDPSEAGMEVLQAQLRSQESLLPAEREYAIIVEASANPPVSDIINQVAARINPAAAG